MRLYNFLKEEVNKDLLETLYSQAVDTLQAYFRAHAHYGAIAEKLTRNYVVEFFEDKTDKPTEEELEDIIVEILKRWSYSNG